MLGLGATGSASTNSRLARIAAALLLMAGIAGLAFAAATQLGTAWSGNFQTGALAAETNCQPADQPIVGRLGDPVFAPTADTPWQITQVQFSGIDSQCFGLNYQVAFRTGGDWQLLATPSAQGVVEGSAVQVELGDADLGQAAEFAITIFK